MVEEKTYKYPKSYWWKKKYESDPLNKEIRCKCGKLSGLQNFKKRGVCRRCKTPVIARGKINDKKTIKF
tara:strand:- start:1657 stop:1863 length:207 start_codon:yes stop_codon:yes gene_type:complete